MFLLGVLAGIAITGVVEFAVIVAAYISVSKRKK